MKKQVEGDQRYPVGKFDRPSAVTPAERERLIGEVEACPGQLRSAVSGLDERQLETPYREGGWTVRQVVHHVPDSHMNAYCRFRLALTEDAPQIRTYEESKWAELADAKSGPVEWSLDLLDALHRRWVALMHSMSEEDWSRTFRHPEWGNIRLDIVLALYAWHGRHHVAHVHQAVER